VRRRCKQCGKPRQSYEFSLEFAYYDKVRRTSVYKWKTICRYCENENSIAEDKRLKNEANRKNQLQRSNPGVQR